MKRLITLVTFTLAIFGTACISQKTPTLSSQIPENGHHQKELNKGTWTCSMHFQIRKDQPGQCPICGMTLVKLEQNEEDPKKANRIDHSSPDHHAPVTLSDERSQMIGVKFGTAEKKHLFKSIHAAGRLAFDPELYTAQNEYSEALRQYARVKDSALEGVRHSAARMVKSSKLRLKVLGLSDQQISQIGTSENVGSNLLVHREGQPVWVYAEIYEMDLPLVRAGQSAEISAGFLGGQTLSGKVISVDRVISPSTRTAKARIQVNHGTTLLRPESYVNVSIKAPLGEQVIVPFDAIFDTGRQSWVFVAEENNKFLPRLVTIKLHSNDVVAISSGLSGGERIVTSANFLIDSESRLKAVAVEQSVPGKVQPSCPKAQHWDVPMAMCIPD